MKVSEFDYELPPGAIAEVPAEPRDSARLLVHDVARDATEHVLFRDLPRFLRAGDLLVVNDTRVVPTRLIGRRRSGGRVELLLVEPVAAPPGAWTALVNPARKPHPGERIPLEDGALLAEMVDRPLGPDGRPEMEWIVRLLGPRGEAVDVLAALEEHGRVPLPPYVHRSEEETVAESASAARERERYQTVYARVAGAVAAPTAGLHFTPRLLAELERAGVERVAVTLHVGPGTFRPVEVEEVEAHRMHSERFHLPEDTARAIAAARARGGRVIAIGTTSVRVLESRVAEDGSLVPGTGSTCLYLFPGRPLRSVDGLVTNFHLPRSTLLMLVAALAGRERVLGLYRDAIARGYRFYSYGDAMLLLRGEPLEEALRRPLR